jgi:hypothetical protein
MNNLQYAVKNLRERYDTLLNVQADIAELESGLTGMEIDYEGNYAIIESVDGYTLSATLYIEMNDGSWLYENIDLEELLEIA